MMDLWLFAGETLGDTVQFAWDLLSGRHMQSDQVERVMFKSLCMQSESPLYVQVDGEPVDIHNGVQIQVLDQALKVLVPRERPHQLPSSSAIQAGISLPTRQE
jgi:diacylglycerol kinase family enzyme